MRILAFYSVWGAEYIDRFLNYALPTQLTQGNLFALPSGSAVKIATRESDVDRFLNSEAITLCKTMLDVEIIAFPDSTFQKKGDDKYGIIQRLQNHALTISRDFDAIIFGYADALWSEGSYRNALSRLAAGYDVILCVGLNVIEGQVIDHIDKRFSALPISERAIAPRDFAGMVYDNLHITARSHFWDHQYMNSYPSFVLWDVKGRGILVRAFHLHPVIIRVQHGDPLFFSPFDVTLDEALVPRLIQRGAVPYISNSSDEMFVCGLVGNVFEEHLYHYPLRPPNIADVVVFGERSASLHHRHFFEEPIRVVFSGDDDEAWQAAEKHADRVCAAVVRRLYLPDDVIKWETPIAYAARAERRTRVVRPHRSAQILTWRYIKTADPSYLKTVALYYFDRKGATVMAALGIGRLWPSLRRRLRAALRLAWRTKRSTTFGTMEDGATRRKIQMLEFVMINTNLWQMIMVTFHLAIISLRPKRHLF